MRTLARFLLVSWILVAGARAYGDEAVFQDIVAEANRLVLRGGRTLSVIGSQRAALSQVSALPRQTVRPLEGERFRQVLASCVFVRRGPSGTGLNEGDQATAMAEFELFLERMRTRGVREYFRLEAPSAAIWPASAPLMAPCVLGVVIGDQVLLLRSQARPR